MPSLQSHCFAILCALLFFLVLVSSQLGRELGLHVSRANDAKLGKGLSSVRWANNTGECLAWVEQEVAPLPKDLVILRNEGVSLLVHDPQKEFISQWAYEKKQWWSWEIFDHMERAVGKYTMGIFLEVGTNIGTVASRFAKEGIPVLTVEAALYNYVRVRASQCINGFRAERFVAVNRAISRNDTGPDLFTRGWDGNQGVTFTTTERANDGDTGTKPVTLDSLAYGEGSMVNYDYSGFDLTLPVWGMKLDCEGCEGVAIVSGRRLLNDARRHPIALVIEITPAYLRDRGGVTAEALYSELKKAGYSSLSCPGYNSDPINSTFIKEHAAKYTQWDCVFVKKRLNESDAVDKSPLEI